MTVLFEDVERTDLGPSSHNENSYGYYSRSARSDVAIIREQLNKWFSNYPDSEKSELKSRFKKTFSSAYYELFIHELFKSQGFEIVIHPIIPNSLKRPDFLMKKGNCEFYLEAKEARDKSQKEEALENRINTFYDSIDKTNSPNFFFYIEKLIMISDKQPKTKLIIKHVESELQKHDPDVVAKQLNLYGLEGVEKIEYKDDDVELIIRLIPKMPDGRNKPGRAIGMFPMESAWGGSEESIKTSVEKKAKRYGALDKPYLICINAIGILGDGDFDVHNALWGSVAITWSENPQNRNERLERKRDGLFLTDAGVQYKNISGILVTKAYTHNIPTTPYWFAKHPFSDNNFDFEIFDLSYNYVESGNINTKAGKTVGQIVNIEENWLKSL